MSIEEEITIYQFGHGVYSVSDILEQFRQLNEGEKRMRLYEIYSLIQQSNPADTDIEQAIASSSLDPTNESCTTLKTQRFQPHMVFLPDGESEKIAELLLHVFKLAYQRSYELEKENPREWWYADFSKPDIVQATLARHRELADEMYNNPSFRFEFVALTKLWYKRKTVREVSEPEPVPEPQTHFDFVTYDEISIEGLATYKRDYDMMYLQNSVTKGLAKQYEVDIDLARRLMLTVIDRHMQETYHTTLL
ncbi:DUF5958 family protein [Spirosoma foliorum]|uniref:Uncharacterized protein n=1 Tax=Spirosoma foliorum TaxID=2710596 RepID=A0A7G5GP70_9BACT|nr:DUF5958 family protein [Spirosoma foliorum]QMW00662.1 hypothetical protein H3H32_22035 [Spirosoma foliorum]